jgi:flagellar protein FliO/FliZ
MINKTSARFVFWVLSLTFGLGNKLYAAESSLSGSVPDFSILMKVVVAMVIILGIIAGLAILLRKFNFIEGNDSAVISIIGAISLGNKDRVFLLKVGEEQIVVGASPGNIQKLYVMKKNVVRQEKTASRQENTKGFSEVIQALTKGVHS